MEDFNNTINKLDLTDLYETLHLTTAEYILSSNHIEHMLGHKKTKVSASFEVLKSYNVYSLTKMELNKNSITERNLRM